jgi:hypothetical protein
MSLQGADEYLEAKIESANNNKRKKGREMQEMKSTKEVQGTWSNIVEM